MTKGGSRNRSGPQADPKSGRSDRRGLKFNQLPAEGWGGDAPEFPLPEIVRTVLEFDEDGKKTQAPDRGASTAFRDRELDVWEEAWRSPQAAAWSLASWRWPTIAEFCRLKTIVELEPDANASLVAQLHRFRDQIGLTPAGLRENGWEIVTDVVTERMKPELSEVTEPQQRRLRAV